MTYKLYVSRWKQKVRVIGLYHTMERGVMEAYHVSCKPSDSI